MNSEANLNAVQDALGMPGASVAEICERIRTLRQTELSAQFLFFRSVNAKKQSPFSAGNTAANA